MTSTNPRSSDFSYKKYSLEQLDNWVNDSLNCDDLTPQDIYDTIVKCVDESLVYHKKYYTKTVELLSLLKGHREVDFDYDAAGGKFPRTTIASQKDWVDFWEETYYPEEHKQYTEEEMNAMCDAAAEKEKCREYNLREAEYYNKRAQLDAEVEAIKRAGGYEWTPNAEVSRNDPTRLKYEKGWIYESPDGGKTVTKRKPGSLEKFEVKADGYSVSKTWRLPVQQGSVDGVDDYYIEFPNDLLKAADLKEGDSVEWIEREDGSCELRKVTKPLAMDEC